MSKDLLARLLRCDSARCLDRRGEKRASPEAFGPADSASCRPWQLGLVARGLHKPCLRHHCQGACGCCRSPPRHRPEHIGTAGLSFLLLEKGGGEDRQVIVSVLSHARRPKVPCQLPAALIA